MFARWRRQLRCRHHWHPIDEMITIWCCRCGKDTDGWMVDRGPCVLEENPEMERTQ